jgi:hypothetical protein
VRFARERRFHVGEDAVEIERNAQRHALLYRGCARRFTLVSSRR